MEGSLKILIVSDTHGRCYYLEKVLDKLNDIDLMIHLGDLEGGEDYIRLITPCPVEMVSGNNDFFNGLDRVKFIQIGKYRVMLTHGHRYGVNFGTDNIKEIAAENNADIVMFGHTHMPLLDLKDKVWAVNPGSITAPRQPGRIPSFIVMDIDRFGEAHFTIRFVDDQGIK